MLRQSEENMEVPALCIRLLINVQLLLLSAQVQRSCCHKADATFPQIVPSKLQLFEFESVFIKCDGFSNDLTNWRVLRKIKGMNTTCNIGWETLGPCNIATAFSMDSGEYWCEAEGKKSNFVDIIVTAGSVILESPVLPVTVGEDVTLRCRNKRSSLTSADFYKDGLHIGSSATGEMTIHSVSKSNKGLYRCNISVAEISPESELIVRGIGSLHEDCPPSPDCSHFGFTVLRIIGTVLLVALGLVMALYYYSKKRNIDLSSLYLCFRFSTKRSDTAERY